MQLHFQAQPAGHALGFQLRSLDQLSQKLRRRDDSCPTMPFQTEQVPVVFRHQIVCCRFLRQREEFSIRHVAGQTGGYRNFTWVDIGPGQESGNEPQYFIIGPPVSARISGRVNTSSSSSAVEGERTNSKRPA